jgi:hypothetical protein
MKHDHLVMNEHPLKSTVLIQHNTVPMRLPFVQRLIASLLLMAYAITGTSVMPAALALMACMDGGHSVMVVQSETGTRVTLHHRSDEYTPDIEDHCSPLARVLVSICSASDSGDHQMTSSSIEAGTRLERDEQGSTVKKAPELNFTATIQHRLTLQPLRHEVRHTAPGLDGTPLMTDSLRTLSTVRLLI